MTTNIQTDFLVIGSGAAGLAYALSVASCGSVAIVTKKNKEESSTSHAQGGIAIAADPASPKKPWKNLDIPVDGLSVVDLNSLLLESSIPA
ncbi:MAG: FAD-binding protein, partial [Deltaproteobacteria bacterium]|nr:FAD-binding protein [Deltaproteobacteria bacterium]